VLDVIFLRHPAPAVERGVCYGRLDLPLGVGHEAEVARALALLPPVRAVLSGPARRCRALADRIALRDGLSPVVDDRLQELDFGRWEGRAWDAIDRSESDPWAADPWTVAPPGGETFAALLARVEAALAAAPPRAAIVTHAGVIRAARMIIAGERFAAAFAAPVPFCTPIRLPDVATPRMRMDFAGSRR
jgi:alpha-ribazole phosphatase